MRLLLDTNVFIASLIARGTVHTLYEYCARQHTIVGSQFILDELHEKLIKKFKYSVDIAHEATRLIQSRMELIVPAPLDVPVCRDPDDDNILALAVTGNCECIITGDKDLLSLQQFNTILIISPATFLERETVE